MVKAKTRRKMPRSGSSRRGGGATVGVLSVLGTVAAAVVIVAALALTITDWGFLRGPIERHVAATTGRAFYIDGPLHGRLRWPEVPIEARQVRFANPSWAGAPQMFTAERVDLHLDLAALLTGKVYFSEVGLTRPRLWLERHADGRKNWLLDRGQRDEDARVPVGRVRIDDGTINYAEAGAPDRGTWLDIHVDSAAPEDALPLRFTLTGRWRGQPLQAAGRGGPVLTLYEPQAPWPIRAEATSGATRLKANGRLHSLGRDPGVDLRIDLAGANLADLGPLLHAPLPATGRYTTSGQLAGRADQWRYSGFTARMGASDLTGDSTVRLVAPRARLEARVHARVLDLADLAPALGSRPHVAQRGRQPGAAQGAVLPSVPFHPEGWRNLDADVRLEAAALRRPGGLPLQRFSAHLTLDDGVLAVDPLDFGIAGGTLQASARLDGRGPAIQAEARGHLRGVAVNQLLPQTRGRASVGRLDGNFDLRGHGATLAAMLGSADGQLNLLIEGGEISRLAMEAAGLHLPEMLMLRIGGDQIIRIHCGLADFVAQDGVLRARTLVFDTPVTRIDGSGNIDLAHERLDLTLQPRTQDLRLIALRSPIYVRGSFDHPQVELDKPAIAARSLGALALGAINPLLALAPLIETGPGTDSACGRLVQAGRRSAARAP